MFRFTEEELQQYKKVRPEWGPVGAVTYKRTYSRPIYKTLGTRERTQVDVESWLDTCVRVVEGNMNLIENDPTATREWANDALKFMFHMGQLPPGRGMWMMGTEYQEKRGGDALVNCWYVGVRPQSYEHMDMFKDTYVFSHPDTPMPSFPFVFMFDRAMLGGGVGFGASRENLSKYPEVTNHVNLKVYLHETHPDWDRIYSSEEWEYIKSHVVCAPVTPYAYPQYKPNPQDTNVIVVNDSREGWDIAVRELIDAHWYTALGNGGEGCDIDLIIDLSSIRAYGDSISGFGGTASGPLSLMDALVHINELLNSRVYTNITSVDAVDMMNLLGRCVVSGNVRRTALIALGDPDDTDYVEAKNYTLTLPIIDTEYGNYGWYTNKWGRKTQKLKDREQVFREQVGAVSNDMDLPLDHPLVIDATNIHIDKMFDTWYKQQNHRWASNNSVFTHELFTDYHFISAGIIANGEPGVGNLWLMKNYGRIMDGFQEAIDGDVEGMNPCFRGDMRLLTSTGYRTFEELDGKDVDIINKDGRISTGKVWCSGVKDTVEVRFVKKPSIYCTPDHRFMTNEGEECYASDLKGKRVMPLLVNPDISKFNKDYVVMGFAQGDGSLNKLSDSYRHGIELNIGKNDLDVWELLGKPEFYKCGLKVYHTDTFHLMQDLGFSDKPLHDREFPSTFDTWSDTEKISFIRGCYSANGSVLSMGRVTYKSTCKNFIHKLGDVLLDLGISCYVTTNKEKENAFYNGTYTMKESYDLNIMDYDSRVQFYSSIGFVQQSKMSKLKSTLLSSAPKVVNVVKSSRVKVYDFTEPTTHWGVVEGVVAHNCGEITLANAEPCNLAEVVPYRCLENGFDIYKALEIATIYCYRVTFAKYSWVATQRVIEKNRRIGVSLTGIQDYFLSKYGHYAIKGFELNEDGYKDITKPIFHENIVKELDSWYQYVSLVNKNHAKLLNSNPSVKLTTCKPSGTVAKLPGVGSGIHWHYGPYLIQRIRFHETDPSLELVRTCGYPVEKDHQVPNTYVVEFPVKAPNADNPNFKSSESVTLEEQFANQYLFASVWADNAVSATLTFKQDEIDKIEPLLQAYGNKIKSTSLLPYSGHGYVQAPWEPITKEEYEKRIKDIKIFIEDAYESHNITQMVDLLDSDCVSGSCPIR